MIRKLTIFPDNTLADLSHLAFCALVALGLARQEGRVVTPYAETLFLLRWLIIAQKQKRFSKSVAVDVGWLLEHGRRYGATARLRQHLDYLWRSTSYDLTIQSDLYRLTYITEMLKNFGWGGYVWSSAEWPGEYRSIAITENSFWVKRLSLYHAFNASGCQRKPVEFRIIGDTEIFLRTLEDYGFISWITGNTVAYKTVIVFPFHSYLN